MARLLVPVVAALWLSSAAGAGETAGVGVALGKEGDGFVVKAVLPDSPAATNGAVHVGDRLVDVAQGDGPAVPVVGKSIDEVVRLIRGAKGTAVRLTVVPAKKDAAQAYVVRLVRGEIKALARWGDGAHLAAGTKAPDVSFNPLGGRKTEHLADFKGKVVVLEFWATWCGPCQRLMADLQGYPGKHPGWNDKVVLIGASVDDDDETPARHVEAKGWDRTHNVRVGDDVLKAFHVNALPTVYVIDQRGNVAAGGHDVDVPAVVDRLLTGE